MRYFLQHWLLTDHRQSAYFIRNQCRQGDLEPDGRFFIDRLVQQGAYWVSSA
jgi:hypothetical protein